MLAEGLLVEVAGDDDGGGHCVEHAEDADAHHELLQLLGLGAVVLHDGADAEERHEAGQQEGRADEQVDEERRQHEAPQRVQAVEAHVAHAAQQVAVHLAQRQDGDGLDGGHGPRGQVEVLRVGLDGLVAPLHAGRQEPGERQDDPPDGAGHAEEVEHHEEDGAALLLGALRHSAVATVLGEASLHTTRSSRRKPAM